MKRHLPPLNALRAFEAAARLGRMTAAADELSVTPGAISRQVQQLEQHLGLRLFEGSKNKPQLTEAGQALLPALTAALDGMATAVRAVSNTTIGTLDVACFSTFAVKWLIPRLFDFNARHPDIEVRLRTAGPITDREHTRYDLSIAVEENASPDASRDATTLPLFAEQLGPVLAPALADRQALRAAADLASHTLLQSRTRLNAWQMWASSQGQTLPTLSGPVYEHYYFTLQAAVAGLGVCIAPWHLVADDVQAGRLLAPLGFCTSGYQYVAKRAPAQQAQHNARLDLFCSWLQTQATDAPRPSSQPSIAFCKP